NSGRYIHAIYQAMNLAYADRDFYYGDPGFPPEEPIRVLLSKDYAKERLKLIDWKKNIPDSRPGDPYQFEGKPNPFLRYLTNWSNIPPNKNDGAVPRSTALVDSEQRGESGQHLAARARLDEDQAQFDADFRSGTTSIQAADEIGWAISVTPSGGWLPACVAGNTGIGMSQRMQSFVLDEAENPFNVVAPGKRPRVTLTPSLALKNGKP